MKVGELTLESVNLMFNPDPSIPSLIGRIRKMHWIELDAPTYKK